jgi:hypothetical protein
VELSHHQEPQQAMLEPLLLQVLEQAPQVQELVLEQLVVHNQILSLLWEVQVEIHTEEWEAALVVVCHQVWECQEVKCQAHKPCNK